MDINKVGSLCRNQKDLLVRQAFTIQPRWLHQVHMKMLFTAILHIVDGTSVVLLQRTFSHKSDENILIGW